MSYAKSIVSALGSVFTGDMKTICDAQMNIIHDGYDEDGPKSNIYFVYVLHKIDDDLVISYFGREDWFDGYGEEYYFNGSYLVKEKDKLPKYLPTVCTETEKLLSK